MRGARPRQACRRRLTAWLSGTGSSRRSRDLEAIERAVQKLPRCGAKSSLPRLDDMSCAGIAERSGLAVRDVERHLPRRSPRPPHAQAVEVLVRSPLNGTRRGSARRGLRLPQRRLRVVSRKTEVDHLPELQQRELARVREILLEEIDKAISTATNPEKRNGKSTRSVLSAATDRENLGGRSRRRKSGSARSSRARSSSLFPRARQSETIRLMREFVALCH